MLKTYTWENIGSTIAYNLEEARMQMNHDTSRDVFFSLLSEEDLSWYSESYEVIWTTTPSIGYYCNPTHLIVDYVEQMEAIRG